MIPNIRTPKVKSTKNLTDRYVYAVTRSLPESQRADIEKELRASIGDAVDGRIEAGETPKAAELATLTELGDPSRLAGEYAERPAWLIGPKYFFDYLRLLKLLYAIVLPITFVAIFVINFIDGGVGQAFGAAFSVGITVAVHLGFWITLIFALAERNEKQGQQQWTTWTPDSLPELPDHRSGRGSRLGEFIGSAVFLGFFAFGLVWQQFNSVFEDAAGNPIPLLNPELWSFWVPVALIGAAIEVAFTGWLYAAKGWTWVHAIVRVPVTLAFNAAAIYLFATHQVWNLEFVDRLGWAPEAAGWADTIAVVVIAAGAIGGIIEGFVKASRASRWAASEA